MSDFFVNIFLWFTQRHPHGCKAPSVIFPYPENNFPISCLFLNRTGGDLHLRQPTTDEGCKQVHHCYISLFQRKRQRKVHNICLKGGGGQCSWYTIAIILINGKVILISRDIKLTFNVIRVLKTKYNDSWHCIFIGHSIGCAHMILSWKSCV